MTYSPTRPHLSRLRSAAALAVAVVSLVLSASLVAEAGTGSIEPSGRAGIEVNFRFMPSHQQVAEAQLALRRMAELICDATEGQVRLRRIRLSAAEADEGAAALWYHGFAGGSGGTFLRDGSDLGRFGAHMDVAREAEQRPDFLAHLFAHHGFGLGDSYAGTVPDPTTASSCGFGSGFETADLDEFNHSIMQLAGGLFCDAGPKTNKPCLRDADCFGSTCSARLASEFSVPTNHDCVRSEGGICPRPRALSRIKLKGVLPESAGPIGAFDSSDFLTARATSSFRAELDLISENPDPVVGKLLLYLTHSARLRWQLTAAFERRTAVGSASALEILKSWTLYFNDDSSLGSIEGGQLVVPWPEGASREERSIVLEVGIPNPAFKLRPGTGFDGLQASKAGEVRVEVESDGVATCSKNWCDRVWSTKTERWEAAAQTIMHGGQSDWETLAANYDFLKVPDSLPARQAPEACAVPPVFIHDIVGADQSLLVLDVSESMGTSGATDVVEVCANGLDDDRDGDLDEHDCAISRIEGMKAAVRLFAALAKGSDAQLGVMAFSSDQELLVPIAPLESDWEQNLAEALEFLEPVADSAIGSALVRAHELFRDVEMQGRSRTGILISDGANNLGVEPTESEQAFDKRRVRWNTLALGAAADRALLSQIAADAGGVALSAEEIHDLLPLLVEIVARNSGEALVLPRTRFGIARANTETSQTGVTPMRTFEFEVESGARELVLVLSAADSTNTSWELLYELSDSEGQRWDERSPVVARDEAWNLLRISDPRPGTWLLRVHPAADGVQASNVTAFVRNPRIDFFADVWPRVVEADDTVLISARPSFVTSIDGPVRVSGEVKRPDGSLVAVALGADPMTGAWSVPFSSFSGRGLYEVSLRVEVEPGAQVRPAESVFGAALATGMRVPAFERTTTTSFYVAHGDWPACLGDDCDRDGLSNTVESSCVGDVDGDGIPAIWDADSDNDEILDGRELAEDEDADGQPDFCDPRDGPTSLEPMIEDAGRAVELACSDRLGHSAAYLDQSVSNLRRLARAVQARAARRGPSTEELLVRLEEATALKSKAFLLADVLPDFCGSYRASIDEALAIEREIAPRISELFSD
jgi:hypothetical protein